MESARLRWLVMLAAVALTAPGCITRDRYIQAKNTIERQDSVIQSYRNRVGAMKDQVSRLQSLVDEKQAALGRALTSEASLRDAHESLAAKFQEIEAKIGSNLPEGVRLVARAEGVAFDVLGEVLFDSGRAEVKDKGKAALLDIVSRIREGSQRIRVEGHTDNVPVTVHKREFPGGNLQLSGARALNVARFLIENGVAEDRVSYAGYGEHRPAADNTSDEGRRQNRRVEIVLLNEPRN